MKDPEAGCPFQQHVYDAVAPALERRISVEQMQVDIPELVSMPHKACCSSRRRWKPEDECPGAMEWTAINWFARFT